MNAFLLVTTALLAGGDPAAPACGSCGTSCGTCNSCDSGCGGCGGFFARLKAMCHCGDCCSSCTTCTTCAPAPVCNPCPAPTCNTCCDSGCGGCGGFFDRLKAMCHCGGGCNSCAPACNTCAPAPACNTCAPACNSCGSCCDSGCGGCGGLLARLKACFHHNDCCDSCNTCNTCGAAAPANGEKIDKPKEEDDGEEGSSRKLPSGKKATRIIPVQPPALGVTPAAAIQVEGTKNPFELDRRYEMRVARAADCSWITGQLFFVHADGGLWVLRYAPLSQEDANGGGVILARGLAMNSYREGDLVTVKGEILDSHGSKYLGAPLYRASSILLVDRTSK